MLKTRDIRALTGIRGIAALVVVLYHIQFGLDVAQNHGLMRFSNGYLAVDLFFILSGFVMSLNYRSRFADAVCWSDYRTFLGRRVKRLFPLYWLICGLFILKASANLSGAKPIDLSFGNLASNLLMIHAWGFDAERFVVPSWSVSAEFVAYFLFPFAVLASRPFRFWPVVAVAIAWGLLGMVRQSGLGEAGPMDVYQTGSLYPLLRCLAGFGLGMAAHALAQTSWARQHLASDTLLLALFAGIGLCSAFHADLLLIGIVFPMLIVNLALNHSLTERLFGNGPVHYLGLISYSIYLVHPLIVSLLIRAAHLVEARSAISAELVATVSVLAATLALAALTHRHVERGRWLERASSALAALRRTGPGRERHV